MNEAYVKEIKNRYNILIVDDDAMIRQFIDDVLQAYQYQTLHACRGEEAFAILESNKVDLIILDLLLPGKHGFYICDKIRRTDKWKDIPILMITAVYTRSKYSNESKEIGANAFMTKPFEGKTLISQVGKLLNIDQI
ncbi:MAG: response regulator [bacterium]